MSNSIYFLFLIANIVPMPGAPSSVLVPTHFVFDLEVRLRASMRWTPIPSRSQGGAARERLARGLTNAFGGLFGGIESPK